MTIFELMQKRMQAWEAAKAFVETHTDANGMMSDADHEVYERMEKDIENYSREIARKQREEAIEAQLAMPVNSPIKTRPMGDPSDEPETGRASRAYREAMLTALRTNFRQVSNVLSEGVDTDGGYLVPEEYDRRLIDVLDEANIMRSLATKITTSGEHKINMAATKPAALWVEEGGALTFGDATFDQIMIDAHKLHVAIKVTNELLYDNAFGLENYIITQFGKALGNAEEDAFLNGDGTGKPYGLFHTSKGGQAKTETAGDTLTADDVINLVYALKRPYRQKASFIVNDSTLAILRTLKDENGAYLWQPSMQAGEPDRLFGYTLHTSQYAPTLQAGKPVLAFGDFSYYNIADRGTRSMQELKELFAGNDMTGYIMKERVDGRLILPEAVQILKMKKKTS